VVILRDGTDDDRPALLDLMTGSTDYAGDMHCLDDGESLYAQPGSTAGVRVAQDEAGLVGMYRTLVRTQHARADVEVTGMLVATRAAFWGVERLLVHDVRERAAVVGAQRVTILTRPPIDVFFRELGARDIGLAAPWGVIGSPFVHMELPV
jgi:hypothetical protein